jgi:hypothetical protein
MDDVVVAAAAAGGTVVLAVLTGYVLERPGATVQSFAPLSTYFAYLFTRRGAPHGPFDTARNWALLAGAVTVAVAVFLAL